MSVTVSTLGNRNMAVRAEHPPSSTFTIPFSPMPDSPWPTSAVVQSSTTLLPERQSRFSSSLSPAPKEEVSTPLSAVAPSPSTSETETVFTDMSGEDEHNDDPTEEMKQEQPPNISKTGRMSTPLSAKSPGLMIGTAYKFSLRRGDAEEEEPPQSVIHIPPGFTAFVAPEKSEEGTVTQEKETQVASRPPSQLSEASTAKPGAIVPVSTSTNTSIVGKSDSNKSQGSGGSAESAVSKESDKTVIPAEEQAMTPADKFYDNQVPPTPLQTSLPSVGGEWTRTPRAQTRQDLAALSRPGSSLASILEGDDYEASEPYSAGISGDEADSFTKARSFFRTADDEIYALKTALAECWTLCNTLASLSYIHRERIFSGYSLRGDMQGQSWRSCWKLCQNLYDSGNEHTTISTRPTLDLCRDFCQTLFEVRVKDNEAADSVLRVSFELNNHLFNTHDRTLPEAFRERTLDFYITLCHRLMKQKTKIAEEPDSLLRACWSLAEMLFSLRQNKRENKKPDEELLGSAIQACWDLCDLFREGWNQIRPERGTPRPSQTTFTQAFNQARRAGYVDDNGNVKLTPETPTTIFEDNVAISPDEAPVPNIMVLRSQHIPTPSSATSTASAPPALIRPNTTQQRVSRSNRWDSVETVLSGKEELKSVSRASSRGQSVTSSQTIKTPSGSEDPMMTLLKALFVRAAMQTNRGFSPDSRSATDHTNPHTSLAAFVKTLSDTAFGTQQWQKTLLDKYKATITQDGTFKTLSTQATSIGLGIDPSKGREDIAMAVRGMVAGTYGWSWLRDLYRYGYGVYMEEVLSKDNDSGGINNHKSGATITAAAKHKKITSKPNNITNGIATANGVVIKKASVAEAT